MNAYLTLAIPESLRETARRIGQHLDPDVGGAYSFGLACKDANDVTYLVCGTPCTTEFCDNAMLFQSHPEALYAAVEADRQARWPDLDPLDASAVQAFCDNVRLSAAYGVMAGIGELGLLISTTS